MFILCLFAFGFFSAVPATKHPTMADLPGSIACCPSKIRPAVSSSHCILTPGQPVQALAIQHQASGAAVLTALNSLAEDSSLKISGLTRQGFDSGHPVLAEHAFADVTIEVVVRLLQYWHE